MGTRVPMLDSRASENSHTRSHYTHPHRVWSQLLESSSEVEPCYLGLSLYLKGVVERETRCSSTQIGLKPNFISRSVSNFISRSGT